jgi:hypothetical protein
MNFLTCTEKLTMEQKKGPDVLQNLLNRF